MYRRFGRPSLTMPRESLSYYVHEEGKKALNRRFSVVAAAWLEMLRHSGARLRLWGKGTIKLEYTKSPGLSGIPKPRVVPPRVIVELLQAGYIAPTRDPIEVLAITTAGRQLIERARQAQINDMDGDDTATSRATKDPTKFAALIAELRRIVEATRRGRYYGHLEVKDIAQATRMTPAAIRVVIRARGAEIAGILGVGSVTYQPSHYTKSGRGAFGRRGGSPHGGTYSPPRLMIDD